MKSLLSILFAFNTLVAFAQNKDIEAVKNILASQQQAWNQGDLEGFMNGYWKNDSLSFIGKSGITYGWTKTLNNYKRGYPDTAAMGKLAFSIIDVATLSPEYIHVTGKWHLTRSVGNLEGYFTLLFRHLNGQWVIISDHSS